MKKGVVILALFILCKPIFPLIEYTINYTYISEVLCINKDKPEVHCDGKCYLMEQLAKQAKKESDKESNATFTFEIPLLFLEQTPSLYHSLLSMITRSISEYFKNSYTYLYNGSIFKPPILIIRF